MRVGFEPTPHRQDLDVKAGFVAKREVWTDNEHQHHCHAHRECAMDE